MVVMMQLHSPDNIDNRQLGGPTRMYLEREVTLSLRICLCDIYDCSSLTVTNLNSSHGQNHHWNSLKNCVTQ